MKEHEWYRIVFDGRNSESTRYWTVFAVIVSINGVTMALLAKFSQNNVFLMCVTSVVGAVTCIFWLLLLQRYEFWVFWWELKLSEIEEMNVSPSVKGNLDFKLFKGRKNAEEQVGKSKGKKGFTFFCSQGVVITFFVAWIFILGAGVYGCCNNKDGDANHVNSAHTSSPAPCSVECRGCCVRLSLCGDHAKVILHECDHENCDHATRQLTVTTQPVSDTIKTDDAP